MGQKEESSSASILKLHHQPASESRRDDEVPAVWNVGDVILGLYEVKDVFWPGARGLVYRVRHREWGVDLAVKSPRETPFETKGQTDSFVEAADAWVGLGPFRHIVSCYYVRKLGGIPRLFLEFVDGHSLQEWIQTGRLYEGGREDSLKRILDIAIQFAWGVGYAHEQNVVHGDIKPANLLMTAEGVAKVKGFGLTGAEAIDSVSGGDDIPSTNSAIYAPEQSGKSELSQHTDIWSWAASVFEMFTGELPWREGELAVAALENYLERGPRDTESPEMPVALAALLGQCLHVDPARRPRSMGEVADDLRQIYRQETGSDHQRHLPIRTDTRADELNNRALSLLDLGRTDEALWMWDEALVLKPQHVEATYNGGLTRWRSGRITDSELIRTLEGLKHSEASGGFINYLLSRVHLERDDAKAAAEALENSEVNYDDGNAVSEAISLRNKGLQSERPFTAFFDDEICGPNLFSPNGQSLLLTVSGFKIRILDFDAPLTPRYLHGHTEAIHALTINADGRYALTSSEDGTIRLWDLASAACLKVIEDDSYRHASMLGLSADGQYAVMRFDPWNTGDTEKRVLQLLDVKAGRRIRSFQTPVSEYGFPPAIYAVSISRDSRYVLTGGQYGEVRLWEVATGRLLRELKGLWGNVRFVQFNPDGKRCSAANNREVREFDINSGTCVEVTIVNEADDDSKSPIVTVSADGNHALFGSSYGELSLWEVNTGRCVRTFQDLTGKPWYEVERYDGIDSVNLSPDGKYSLSATRGGTYKLWRFDPQYHAPLMLCRITATEEAINNQIAAEENLANAQKAIAAEHYLDAANYLRTARSVPGYERSPEALELWASLYAHLPRTHLKASWLSHEIKGQPMASSISFDADGKYALFGGFDMELKEVATDRCLRVFDKAGNGKAALSGDARLIMIGGWDYYELWDTMSGHRITKNYSSHEKHVKDIKLSLDGKFAASCTEETFDLWKITDEGLRYLRSTKTDWGELSAVAISSDNKYCVAGTGFSSGMEPDYRLRLWELPSVEYIKTFDGYDKGTYALVFSPDNNYFLGGGFDHKLRLWDIATGECVRSFEGHTQSVYSVDISSDGKYALSGSPDQTLRMWDMATGECLRAWEIKTDFIGPVRFSSDCKYILANTTGFVVRVEVLDWELEDREP
jgi:WD40 repeat protein/serine/threonine protein kinase